MTSGLTDERVQDSREKHGTNNITKQPRKTLFASFIANFGDPIIKVLLAALAINVIFLMRNSDWLESVGIAIAILLATIVATISEYGSETAFEKLQDEASRITVRVRRNGAVSEISLEDVVVGDIVLLQAGERIPADGIIIEGRLDVDQSTLNGESKEAKKFPNPHAKKDDKPAECKTEFLDYTRLFSATVVCAGEGIMEVTTVGDSTFYGGMAKEMQEETRESPLKVRLGNFAKTISKFGYTASGLVAVVYLVNNWLSGDINNWVSFFRYLITAATIAVSIIVMAVPEGLPMMITVVLSTNMKKMLADNVLVRKLVGIETAGSLNILFTDKTGTITKGKLEVTCFVDTEGNITEKIPDNLHESLIHNTSATINESGIAIGGNTTDRSLLEYAHTLGKPTTVKKLGTIPFSSDQKFMATTICKNDENLTLIKGAPERILPLCNNANLHAINKQMENLASQAMRIIAVATSDKVIPDSGVLADFGKLSLIGLLGIRDEVRTDAAEGVRKVQNAGVQVVMITGDAKSTATAIAKDVGIVKDELKEIILTSDELAEKSDEELLKILPDLRIVARALPSDKSRLVRIAQSLDLVVGMTGDGVNDAPALKKADVGFAMGSGTEVAKEAGDIIILDDNISSIVQAVSYGRAIFKNIRKFIVYQLTVSMGAVGISILGPFIGIEHPVTVIQMLWINIVMDTLAGLAFSGEKARAAYMKEQPKRRDEPIMTKKMWNQIVICAGYITALCIIFLRTPTIYSAFMSRGTSYMLTGFFALFMMTAIFMSFCARTSSTNLFSYILGNKGFLVIMGSVTVAQTIIVYIGGTLFRTSGLLPRDFLLVAAMAATIIPLDIIRKRIYNNVVDPSPRMLTGITAHDTVMARK